MKNNQRALPNNLILPVLVFGAQDYLHVSYNIVARVFNSFPCFIHLPFFIHFLFVFLFLNLCKIFILSHTFYLDAASFRYFFPLLFSFIFRSPSISFLDTPSDLILFFLSPFFFFFVFNFIYYRTHLIFKRNDLCSQLLRVSICRKDILGTSIVVKTTEAVGENKTNSGTC